MTMEELNRLRTVNADLMQALNLLIGAVEQHCMSDDPDVAYELALARLAMAKAEGESK